MWGTCGTRLRPPTDPEEAEYSKRIKYMNRSCCERLWLMQLRDIAPAVLRVDQITGADRLYFRWRQPLNKIIIFITGLSRDWVWQVDIISSKHNKCLAHNCGVMCVGLANLPICTIFFRVNLTVRFSVGMLVLCFHSQINCPCILSGVHLRGLFLCAQATAPLRHPSPSVGVAAPRWKPRASCR